MLSRLLIPVVVTVALVVAALAADRVLSVGQRFHYETSYGDEGFKAENPLRGKNVPLYKEYEKASKTKLPAPAGSKMSLVTAIEERHSVRSFSDKALGLAELSRLLLTANGRTHSESGWQSRSAPSAGALYPIDIYVLASSVEGLKPGLYHFQVSDSSLELVAEGDFGKRINEAANGQRSVGFSPATIVVTARFDRVTVKYSDRGYRYAYIEAGCVCQNVYLQAAALGLGTVVVGAFNDDLLNGLLGIDGVSEAGILIMPVGYPQ